MVLSPVSDLIHGIGSALPCSASRRAAAACAGGESGGPALSVPRPRVAARPGETCLALLGTDGCRARSAPGAEAVLESFGADPPAAGLQPARDAAALEQPYQPGLARDRDVVPCRILVELRRGGEHEMPPLAVCQRRRERAAQRKLQAHAGSAPRVLVEPKGDAADVDRAPLAASTGSCCCSIARDVCRESRTLPRTQTSAGERNLRPLQESGVIFAISASVKPGPLKHCRVFQTTALARLRRSQLFPSEPVTATFRTRSRSGVSASGAGMPPCRPIVFLPTFRPVRVSPSCAAPPPLRTPEGGFRQPHRNRRTPSNSWLKPRTRNARQWIWLRPAHPKLTAQSQARTALRNSIRRLCACSRRVAHCSCAARARSPAVG